MQITRSLTAAAIAMSAALTASSAPAQAQWHGGAFVAGAAIGIGGAAIYAGVTRPAYAHGYGYYPGPVFRPGPGSYYKPPFYLRRPAYYAPAPVYHHAEAVHYQPAPVHYHAAPAPYSPTCWQERRPVFDSWGNPAGSRKMRVCQ